MRSSQITGAMSVQCLLLGAAMALAGCEAQMAALSGRQAISPGDFADAEAAPNVSRGASASQTFVDSDAAATPVTEAAQIETGSDAVASATDVSRTVSASPPMAPQAGSAPSSGRPRQRVIVDSLIGQVNGRPIFADQFLEPIEDQILAARAQLSPQEFIASMDRIIYERLRVVVFNELVLAEAETMLTDETRVGLRYWLKDVEEKRLAQSLGVRSRAEEELAAEGTTLDEYLAMQKDEALVFTLVKQKIEPRVIVTWRDLEREYEQRSSEFNPPASATLAKIVLNREREQDMIDTVETGLAEGRSFEEIGESLPRSSAYSEDTYRLGPNGLADLPLSPAILEAIVGLEVGATTQPVEVVLAPMQRGETERVTVYWYHIKAIEQGEARTLYDPAVQRRLYNELYRRRMNEEQDRYLESLLSKGIVDNVDEMFLRLRTVALLRYGRAS